MSDATIKHIKRNTALIADFTDMTAGLTRDDLIALLAQSWAYSAPINRRALKKDAATLLADTNNRPTKA